MGSIAATLREAGREVNPGYCPRPQMQASRIANASSSTARRERALLLFRAADCGFVVDVEGR